MLGGDRTSSQAGAATLTVAPPGIDGMKDLVTTMVTNGSVWLAASSLRPSRQSSDQSFLDVADSRRWPRSPAPATSPSIRLPDSRPDAARTPLSSSARG